jgi:small subunit ribosomal protein S21|tara:strand:- start:312 stop:533 length:222 start_codon:yes stop_codon:yes gene_type:complete
VRVKVRNNNVESAVRVFKKKCNEVMFEYREREYYDKPSAKRHRAKQSAKARERRRQQKDDIFQGRTKKFKPNF